MSIKISLREPKGSNLAKLLRALATYIDEDQAIDFYCNLSFVTPKDGEKE